MRHTETIHLIKITVNEDDIGNQVEVPVERSVFANELYVSGTEFYKAAVTGIKPEKQFEIYSFEYGGESKLKHNGVTYNIIRSEKRGDKTRITCVRVAADG